jgi:hypothetical protein
VAVTASVNLSSLQLCSIRSDGFTARIKRKRRGREEGEREKRRGGEEGEGEKRRGRERGRGREEGENAIEGTWPMLSSLSRLVLSRLVSSRLLSPCSFHNSLLAIYYWPRRTVRREGRKEEETKQIASRLLVYSD